VSIAFLQYLKTEDRMAYA